MSGLGAVCSERPHRKLHPPPPGGIWILHRAGDASSRVHIYTRAHVPASLRSETTILNLTDCFAAALCLHARALLSSPLPPSREWNCLAPEFLPRRDCLLFSFHPVRLLIPLFFGSSRAARLRAESYDDVSMLFYYLSPRVGLGFSCASTVSTRCFAAQHNIEPLFCKGYRCFNYARWLLFTGNVLSTITVV